MKLMHKIKNLIPDFRSKISRSWWVEIITARPKCVYYFGPFQEFTEAKIAYPGYIEDLEREAAQEIVVNIKRCQPNILTVFDEDEN